MEKIIGINEARPKLSSIIENLDKPIIITRHKHYQFGRFFERIGKAKQVIARHLPGKILYANHARPFCSLLRARFNTLNPAPAITMTGIHHK